MFLPPERLKKLSEVIRAENLKKYFPVQKNVLEQLFSRKRAYVKAVDDLTFSIKKKEIFTLAGESGCGKTTTGRVLLRLTEPTSGRIYFNGEDITGLKGEKLRVLRQKMQVIFQDPYASLNPRMRVGDAIGHPLEIHGIANPEEKKEAVLEVLARVGLTPPDQFVGLYPLHLSGGQRQRVALARSIILKPEFIVADEPVSMIDVSLRTTIIDVLLSFRDILGLTYLFVTHDLAVAKYISDRIAIMYLGKIVEIGTKQEIFSTPIHPYTKALLSVIPVPDPKRKRKAVELAGEVPSAINVPAGCRFHPRCPFAEKKCNMEEAELLPITSTHSVACHRK
jgi:peptide/nickel transport system ATP-binding protein